MPTQSLSVELSKDAENSEINIKARIKDARFYVVRIYVDMRGIIKNTVRRNGYDRMMCKGEKVSERSVVRYCAPTLAGLKTACLFVLRFESQAEMKNEIRKINRVLTCKGVRTVPLKIDRSSALIYVYRPSMLMRDLGDGKAAALLREHGYETDASPESCVAQLMKRLKHGNVFPHEIGVFLGYPPDDVRDFIENGAAGYKLCGCWKVYSDAESAARLFAKYKNCTRIFINQFEKGKTIDKLTIVK